MMCFSRRDFLCSSFALTPIATALASLGGCSKDEGWPEGMQPIKWDRDTCIICNMAISDKRFAGEMRGGPKNTVFKFDDPGCIALCMHDKAAQFPWVRDPATKIWVMDSNVRGNDMRWLDARTAQYAAKFSPMGYNFGAVAYPQAGAVDFATMSEHVVALVRKNAK
jgi:copper chaperone NosL